MPIPTNKLGLLCAEIDSAGSLKLAGDRVLFGARKSALAETEWLTRQKVAQCREMIAEIVHAHRGIVARVIGDQVFCQLPNASAAVTAACEIQRAQAGDHRSEGEEHDGAALAAPLGIKIAAGFGSVAVDAGKLAGDPLAITRELLKKTDADQVIVTRALVEALGDALGDRLRDLGSISLEGIAEEQAIWEVRWNDAMEQAPRPARFDQAARAGEAAARPEGAAPPAAPARRRSGTATTPAPAGDGAPEPAAPPRPRMKLMFKGKELVLDAAHPTLMLRSGKTRTEHAKISLVDDGFLLENLNVSGTRVRRDDREELCLDEAPLAGEGAISLGVDFSQASQVIEFVVERP